MAEPEKRGNTGAAVWASFLLVLGAVFILQTTGVLPWTLWAELWRFWPSVLIVAGIALLMRRSFWLMTLVSLVIYSGAVGIAIWQHGPVVEANVTTAVIDVSRSGEERLEIDINFDAVGAEIGSLAAGASVLARIESDEVNGVPRLRLDQETAGGVTKLRLRTTDFNFSSFDWDDNDWSTWRIDLARDIPLEIDIDLAAGALDIDLTELDVDRLTVDASAGGLEIRLPEGAGLTEVVVDAAVAGVEIVVPDGVAARITSNAALGAVNVDTRRFPRKGGGYESDDYEDAENRVNITVNVSLGGVNIR